MTIEPEPAPAPPKRSTAWWVLGCSCSGCLLTIVLVIGSIIAFSIATVRTLEGGRETATQRATFESILGESGTPPGFQIALANEAPWPMRGHAFVIFVPEQIQGEFVTQVQSSDTVGVLLRVPEVDAQRLKREDYFDEKSCVLPAVFHFADVFGVGDAEEALRDATRGTLSGHRFPLRFVATREEGDDRQVSGAPAETRKPVVRVSRRRPSAFRSFAVVDLTAPETRGSATILFVLRRSESPVTADELTEFCRNFRLGE